MTARRRLLAAALVLPALAACEKPAPLVTVVSGDESVYTEAAVFCFDEGQTLQSGECAERAQEVPVLEVRGGSQIGVDVGKEVVERGWRLELADPADPQNVQQSPVLDDHYFTFTAPGLQPEGELLLTVRTVEQGGEAATGEWRFLLRPAD